MIFSINGSRIRFVLASDEHKRLNAGLTAKGEVKLKASPFTVEFLISESATPTKDPPTHTPIEKELP
jgi:hypothetical protein